MAPQDNFIEGIRREFPLLNQLVDDKPLIYFDNAATTQKPNTVIATVEDYYRSANANVHRASHALSAIATSRFEQARQTIADYLNAPSPKQIIWTRGTTEAINLVANSFGQSFQPGDQIIVSEQEHHANIVPWQLLAERSGAVIKVIPVQENGELDQAVFKQLLNERTKLVAITHVSNALGTINPVKQMISQAHDFGAKVLIDGAQALPHFQVDVQELDADFYVFSGHKIYAPTGIGVLYGKESLLESMPPWQAGGEMIEKVSFSGTTFNRLPFKFEAGTPNIAGALGLAEAVRWLIKQPFDLISQHEKALFDSALDACSSLKGFRRIGCPEKHVSLLSFTIEQFHQQDIGLLLDKQGIAIRTGHHCAMPLMHALGLNGTSRASFAFYNTLDEVGQFATALEQLISPISIPVKAAIHQDKTGLVQELLKQKGWNARYRQIMLYGKDHSGLDDSAKSESNLVPGCESQTWLTAQIDKDGKYQFQADSEARIIRGLIAVVLSIFNNKNSAEINRVDIDMIFNQLELQQHLSPSRGNGLRAVIERIYQIANQSEG
ncbi:SufS family cysteine desulfurase [Neptuniibacter caesariensis]|uniref:cysteine desulfurase n=1 Tax=Neptuniibacter caesariensis TaxID=207954 RepID=A0A7U8C4B1_NEPCE|nr:SufS family cysteine desulfurase [Neptuniibacter caesariensis]EAR61247.1 putative selenocysteine lyase [Oceanospirillum sp. MED92] [Neptuniibacter caesariensis]